MSNIVKLNSYDIKDATARTNIASLDEQINDDDTGIAKEISDLQSSVSAIEEAINDETTGIEARLTAVENASMDLSNILWITTNDLTGDTIIITEFYNGCLAWNNDSKWFKCFIYFRITVTPSENNRVINIPIPNGFNVSETYDITNVVNFYNNDGTYRGVQGLHITPQNISIIIPKNLDGSFVINALPYLYYNANIETPQE